jgi:polyhydroxyalkanoate synthesis regulator phasin
MGRKDAWRAYYELALGLTETSRKKATKIVKDVAGKGGGTADQLQELVNTAVANREAIARMVKVELDRALGRVGLATMDEVDELTKRVRELERELAAYRAGGTPGPAEPSAVEPAAPETAVASRAVKKTVAKKAVAKKTAVRPVPTAAQDTTAPEETPAATTVPEPMTSAGAPAKAPVKKAAAKKTVAKKTVAKKTVAKKTAAKKTAAKKVTPTKAMKPEKASVTRQTLADRDQ